jgi:hypothetical protein
MAEEHVVKITQELQLTEKQVRAAFLLLKEGRPFHLSPVTARK